MGKSELREGFGLEDAAQLLLIMAVRAHLVLGMRQAILESKCIYGCMLESQEKPCDNIDARVLPLDVLTH